LQPRGGGPSGAIQVGFACERGDDCAYGDYSRRIPVASQWSDREAEQRHEIQKRERLLRHRPIVLIDDLLSDLDTLNLKSVSRVPRSNYESRLLKVRAILSHAAIPSDQLQGLRTRIGIVNLMDELYAVQEMPFSKQWADLGTSEHKAEAGTLSDGVQWIARRDGQD
jgi:hypothetical protein